MFITLEKKKFIEAVSIVNRFAQQSNSTLPALASILIIASDEGVRFRATNLETGVDLKVDGDIKTNGVVAIPSTILKNLASSFIGEGSITLENTGDIIIIRSGTGKSSIKTIPYDDFPSIPFPEDAKGKFVISGTALRTLVTSIGSCASISTVRPELSSIYLSIENGILTATATDSFRLIEKKIPLANKTTQSKVLIPAKNALEVSQALPDDDVIVSFDEHQCAFIWDKGTLVSRLTNAVYPDYHQIIPKEFIVEAVVHRRDFENALKQSSIFTDSFQKLKLSFDKKTNSLECIAKNQDIGDSLERIPAQIKGESLELSFNYRYLIHVLSLTKSEHLNISASGIGRPLIIKGVGDSSFLYLVSPMNQ